MDGVENDWVGNLAENETDAKDANVDEEEKRIDLFEMVAVLLIPTLPSRPKGNTLPRFMSAPALRRNTDAGPPSKWRRLAMGKARA
mmetsp:Transcript_10747/g.31814  ORF Transcript_10747/g.31814 Transcript_10747/m.31814 type:complete len:86 (-) Transcript_10747:718-975(-)